MQKSCSVCEEILSNVALKVFPELKVGITIDKKGLINFKNLDFYVAGLIA